MFSDGRIYGSDDPRAVALTDRIACIHGYSTLPDGLDDSGTVQVLNPKTGGTTFYENGPSLDCDGSCFCHYENGVVYLTSYTGDDFWRWDIPNETSTQLSDGQSTLKNGYHVPDPDNGYIYNFGGGGDNERYDVDSDNWVYIQDSPNGVARYNDASHSTPEIVDGKVYIPRGSSSQSDSQLYEYDIAADSWSTIQIPYDIMECYPLSYPSGKSVWLFPINGDEPFITRYDTQAGSFEKVHPAIGQFNAGYISITRHGEYAYIFSANQGKYSSVRLY